MGIRERERILENIGRLRRVEEEYSQRGCGDGPRRSRSATGWTVSRSQSASLLGVSHTALNNWIAAGDVPVVISERGRKEVPIPTLLELQERVDEERKSGRRKLHTLEPVMHEARRHAERMRPRAPAPGSRRRSDPHRTPELRALAYHRAIAPRLRRPMIDTAQRKLRRWTQEDRIDPRYAQLWEDVFGDADVRDSQGDHRGRRTRTRSPRTRRWPGCRVSLSAARSSSRLRKSMRRSRLPPQRRSQPRGLRGLRADALRVVPVGARKIGACRLPGRPDC